MAFDARPLAPLPARLATTITFRRSASLAQAAFFVTAVVTGWNAFASRAWRLPDLLPWDKAEHFAAFFLLTAFGLLAFRRVPALSLGIVLSAAGAGIELIQAIPSVGRDGDLRDWVSDTVAVAAVLAVHFASQARHAERTSGLF